jgi:hypothetical protein
MGVDRVHGAAGRAQAGDQQAAGGLDGHRDRGLGSVAVLGQELEQLSEPVGGVIDPCLGRQRSGVVDYDGVVVVAGPVDAAEQFHGRARPLGTLGRVAYRGWSQPRGARVALMAGLDGPSSD